MELQDNYSVKPTWSGYLFMAESTDDFSDLPRFEPNQVQASFVLKGRSTLNLNQNIECSSNCNASRHNINSILSTYREEGYIIQPNVPS